VELGDDTLTVQVVAAKESSRRARRFEHLGQHDGPETWVS
jgi:hypothetical protein